VLVSSDLGQHAAWLNDFAGIGFSELLLHQVGRNQIAFLEAFGAKVLPQLGGRNGPEWRRVGLAQGCLTPEASRRRATQHFGAGSRTGRQF
jgi:hypothetical protein